MPATFAQRQPPRRLAPSRAGFTLIEILVVVVILGIAAAVIVPQISSRSDLKATSAARLIMADLIYVQNRSISQQKYHYIQFDPTTASYTVKSMEGSPAVMTVITHPVEQSPFVVALGPAGPGPLQDVKIDSVSFDGQKWLAFDEMGTPYAYNPGTSVLTPMASGTISLKCKEMVLNIIIEPFTGELRLGPMTPTP